MLVFFKPHAVTASAAAGNGVCHQDSVVTRMINPFEITFMRASVESGFEKNFFPKYITKQPQSFEFAWRGTC
jgi:hypothetical protein